MLLPPARRDESSRLSRNHSLCAWPAHTGPTCNLHSAEESAFTLLLSASSVDSNRFHRAEAALRNGPDWSVLVEQALYHRMVPALVHLFEAIHPSHLPTELWPSFQAHILTIRRQCRSVIEETFTLVDALAANGIVAVPFKGPLLSERLFGDAALRSPGDIDILVKKPDVATLCALLEARGYEDAGRGPSAAPLTDVQRRMYEHVQCEYTYVRSGDSSVVEPHWGLTQRPLAVDVDYEGMLGRAQQTLLAGRAVLALAPEDLLVALCVHGSKHRWQRLAWIRDVAGVLALFPDIDFQRVMGDARARGYLRLLLVSLAVARACSGASLPDQVIELIETKPKIVSLREDILGDLFRRRLPEARNDVIDRFRLQLRERWVDRARYVVRTLTSPRRHHLETVSLPSALRSAYYVAKIGIDYAYVPMRGILKLRKVGEQSSI